MPGSKNRCWIFGIALLIASCQSMSGLAPEDPLILKGGEMSDTSTITYNCHLHIIYLCDI